MIKPHRLYTASQMAEGIKTVHEIGLKALQVAPAHSGPMAAAHRAQQEAVAEQAAAQPEPQVEEHHCLSCAGKKKFTVEGEEKLPNGAIRRHGTGECGHKMSKIVSGNGAT